MQGDQYFADNLVKYKRHLLKCGYASESIDKKFFKAAKIKREKTIALKEQKLLKSSKREYYFVTDYDPEFPNIRMCSEKISTYMSKTQNAEVCSLLKAVLK